MYAKKKRERTSLQEAELATAREKLPSDAIGLMEENAFNWLQLKAIREAFEAGLGTAEVRQFAYPEVSAEDMNEAASAIREGQPLGPLPKHRWTVPAYTWMGLLLAVLAAGLGYGLQHRPAALRLDLKEETAFVSCGSDFDPARYVAGCSEDAQLILPKAMTFTLPETRLVLYRAVRGNQAISRILRVVVRDDKKPGLEIAGQDAVIPEGKDFNCHDYVIRAIDDIDGDLKGQVACTYQEDPVEWDVRYQVKDRAGNTADAVLHVRRIASVD